MVDAVAGRAFDRIFETRRDPASVNAGAASQDLADMECPGGGRLGVGNAIPCRRRVAPPRRLFASWNAKRAGSPSRNANLPFRPRPMSNEAPDESSSCAEIVDSAAVNTTGRWCASRNLPAMAPDRARTSPSMAGRLFLEFRREACPTAWAAPAPENLFSRLRHDASFSIAAIQANRG